MNLKTNRNCQLQRKKTSFPEHGKDGIKALSLKASISHALLLHERIGVRLTPHESAEGLAL